MLTFRGLDLIGALLVNEPGLGGLTFFAAGSGSPDWDATPAPPAPGDTGLVAETFRRRLVPGQHVRFDAEAGELVVRLAAPAGSGPLREFGLFGGDASPRPGSGRLFSVRRHALIERGDEAELPGELRLRLPAAMPPGGRALVGRLLAGERGVRGLSWAAIGTGDAGEEATALAAEVARTPLDRRTVVYDAPRRTVRARVRFDYAQGPARITECGLLGGVAGQEALVAYQPRAPLDRTRPVLLEQAFDLVLTTDEAVQVPDVTGAELAAARAALVAAGLVAGEPATVVDDTRPRGTVAAQDPEAGATLRPGQVVALRIAVPTQVRVPALVGVPLEAAAAVLEAAGLALDEQEPQLRESEAPAGSIVDCSPAAGAVVDRGSGVRVTVATPVLVDVPDLRGRTAGAATTLLAAARLGLAPPPFPERQSSATAGAILDHAPAPGARAPAGSAVQVTVARGWGVTVPDLRELTPDAARTALRDAGAEVLSRLGRPELPVGLALGRESVREDAAPPGTIVAQEPAAGALGWLYGTVDVQVAAPVRGVVPAVVGTRQEAAVSAIVAAGLAVGRVTARMGPEVPATVVAQSPAAGTRWPTGALVTLTVATPVLVAVPAVTGVAVSVAREALTGRGLEATVSITVGQQPPGTVSAQAPAADTPVARGSTVALTVIAGVPDLVGERVDAARALVESVGLALGDPPDEEERDVEPGTVLAQEPAPGSPASPGDAVRVVLAVPVRVAVPDLTGLPLDEAGEQLATLRLALEVRATLESDAREGTIVQQEPGAGTRVPPESVVGAWTAVPPVPVTVEVPDMRGRSAEEAKRILAELGLGLRVGGEEPADAPAGTVLAQDPTAGKQVEPGTVVIVIIARSPDTDTVQVPNVRQEPVDKARERLRAAGLQLEVVGRRPSTQPVDTVVDQSPGPDTAVPVASTVSVVLADVRDVDPRPIVPLLLNQSRVRAQTIAARAGFELRVAGRRFAPGVPADTVVAQDPAAGSHLERGGTVAVVVSTSLITPDVPGRVPIDPRIPINPIDPVIDVPILPPRPRPFIDPGGIRPLGGQ